MAKEKDTVVVEMTESQKNKVVDFLASEEKAPDRSMFLNFQHERNNKKYGPGRTLVPGVLAGALEAADNQAMLFLLKQNQSSDTMIEILGRGLTRVVKGGR